MKILNKIYEDYFKYLCKQVKLGKPNGYDKLALALFETDYIFLLPDDENREIDGIEERERFIYSYKNATSIEKVFLKEDFSCSVFEMLIGVSRRMANAVYDLETGSSLSNCFYTLLDNLGLSKYNDEYFDNASVKKILYNFIDRNYNPNGQGSLFPLKHSKEDMSKMPIWLQMTEFLFENDSKLPKSLGYIKL